MSTAEPEQEPTTSEQYPPDDYPTLKEPSPTEKYLDDHPTLKEPAPGEEYPEEYPTLLEPPAPVVSAPGTRAAFSRIDPVSVGTGLVFFLIGGAYLLASGGHVTVNAGWTLSLLLLGLGLSGLIGGLLGRRSARRR